MMLCYVTCIFIRKLASHLSEIVKFICSLRLVLATAYIRVLPRTASRKISATKARGSSGWRSIRAVYGWRLLTNHS